jgi:nicotinamide-nucleotide amidase
MKIKILSTGDEIVSGGVVDTNASWLADSLLGLGLTVDCFVAVGDDFGTLRRTIADLAAETDILIVTGGLGPTNDDITAEAAAGAVNTKTILNPEALGLVTDYFNRKGWPMNPSNKKQAVLPRDCRVIENEVGTAPGFYLRISGCHGFFMPGVPKEMKAMTLNWVLPWIQRYAAKNLGRTLTDITPRTITVFGLPESEVGARLKDLATQFPGVRPGFRADFPLIQVKLYPDSEKRGGGENILDQAEQFVVTTLGRWVISREGLTMEQEVGRLLVQKKATIALAESCTGGLMASMLTDVPGSSDYFIFSGVTYSNEAKIRVLGVRQSTLESHGAVSEETAGEMAQGVRRLTQATYGISTSGVAGPGGGSPEKPVGTVCIGIAGPGFCTTKRYGFAFNDRTMNKQIFAVTALGALRKRMLMQGGSV